MARPSLLRLVASDKAIASGEAAKVVKAHEAAMKFISEHPDEAIAIAVKHTGMDEKTVREAFRTCLHGCSGR